MVTPTPIFEIKELIGEILIHLDPFELQTASCVNNLFYEMCGLTHLSPFRERRRPNFLWNVLTKTFDTEKRVPLEWEITGPRRTIIYKDNVDFDLSDSRVRIGIKDRTVGTIDLIFDSNADSSLDWGGHYMKFVFCRGKELSVHLFNTPKGQSDDPSENLKYKYLRHVETCLKFYEMYDQLKNGQIMDVVDTICDEARKLHSICSRKIHKWKR